MIGIQFLIDKYFHPSENVYQIKCVKCCPHEKCSPPTLCHLQGVCARRNTQQSFEIVWAPQFLFVQLIRWRANGTKVNTKVSLHGEFKLTDKDNYEPIGVLCHDGTSPNNGHYITHIKSNSGQWFLYDDENIKGSSIDNAGGANTYIMLYKKKSVQSISNQLNMNMNIDSPLYNNITDTIDTLTLDTQNSKYCDNCKKQFKSIPKHLNHSNECK